MLIVFLDDFTDGLASGYHGSSHVEDVDEATTLGNCQGALGLQSSRMIHISKTNIQSKHSTHVVMLTRSTNKMKGGFHIKLQSSLDMKIHFLIRKCRKISRWCHGGTTIGSRHVPRGKRSASSLSGARIGGILFALDAVKVMALVDRSVNHNGEPSKVAIGIIEDILNGKEYS